MTNVLVPKSAESFIRFLMHSWKIVRREREGRSLSIASTPDLSNNDSRKRRGVAMICVLFLQVLLMGGALLLGVMLPVEPLAAHESYTLIGRPAEWARSEKAIVNLPSGVAGVRVEHLNAPDTSKLPDSLLVADVEIPRIWHPIPSVLAPGSPLPAPAVGLDGPPPPKKNRSAHRSFRWRGWIEPHQAFG
jgi:hypothetical protein